MTDNSLEHDVAIRNLAKQIQTLRREMRSQARAAQGPRRSVDVTEGGTTYYAEDGTPLLQIGQAEDGEFGIVNVDPTVPPPPTAPDVVSVDGGIKIVWDGTFVDSNWPTSVSHVEAHVSATADFEATDQTQVTVFSSQNGGEFVYAATDEAIRHVALVAVALSGVESEKSEEVSAARLPGTDGDPPATAPVVTLTPGIGSMFVKWGPVSNPDPVTYRVYASSDAVVDTSPTSPELLGEVEGTLFVARKFADGASLPYTADAHFAVVAVDEDGPGPASAVVAGRPATVTGPDIAANSVTANEIAANAVTASELAANAVTATKIAANAVTATKIAADAVTAAKIAADSVTADKIAADAVTATKIAADSVTAAKIAVDSITADKMAAGAVTTTKLAANAITADKIATGTLTGDLFSGNVVLGSTISTGEIDPATGEVVGARVELGPSGFKNLDGNGDVVVSFPLGAAELAYVRAHTELLSAEVQDNFTMHGTNNTIAKDAALILSEGVTAPTVPPVISSTYDTVQLDTQTAVGPLNPQTGYNLGVFALNASQIRSMGWSNNSDYWFVIQQKSEGARIWRFTANGSIKMHPTLNAPWVDDYNDFNKMSGAFNDVTPSVGILFEFGATSPRWYCYGFTPTGAGANNKLPESWILDSKTPSLGYDTINDQYVLVQNNGGGAGTIQVRRFHLVEGTGFPAPISDSVTEMEAGSGSNQRINGVVYGTQAVAGQNRYVFSNDTLVTNLVYDTAGVYKATESWVKPAPGVGFAHNGTQFASIDTTGKITLYENWTWTDANTTAWVGVSLYDSDTAGDQANPHTGQLAGQHETPVGGLTSFTQLRRAKLTINVPETPDGGLSDDPDKWRVYFARQAAEPTAAQLKLAGTVGIPTARSDLVLVTNPTGVAPPGKIQGDLDAVNNFPAATPAMIQSAHIDANGPIIDLRGGGAGRVGSLSWESPLFVVEASEPLILAGETWHTIGAAGEPAFTNGYTQFNPCRFRKDAAANVHLHGTVNVGTDSASMFTLPLAYRPSAIFALTGHDNLLGLVQFIVNTNGTVVCNYSGTPARANFSFSYSALA